eukprot:108750-Ditylum_brightwellii.AAC.1
MAGGVSWTSLISRGIGPVDNICIVPNDGQHPEEYGHPVTVAADVGMIVCNPLVSNVYTTHPVVVVINEG